MSKSINKFIPKKKSIYKNKRCFKHEKEISSRKFTIIFLEFFFLMIFYNSISLTEEKSLGIRKLDTSSIVTMIIEGSGTKKVLGNGFAFSPNEVYINNENKALESSNEYLLGNSKNNVTLIFNQDINTCANMFYNMDELLEVDLSKFISNQVTNMQQMFGGCKKLTSINFSNFKTINVIHMNSMFSGCIALPSIDLSNFDTSHVSYMNNMFYNCASLTLLNISNFDVSHVTALGDMFNGCSSLFSLELSNLTFSASIYSMPKMFANCKNLIYLDISNFKISFPCGDLYALFENCTSLKYLNLEKATNDKNLNWNNFFRNAPNDIIYCATDTKIINNLPGDMTNNCLDACFQKNNKMILDKKICISECNLDNIYKYEYNNFCYQKCPEGYYDSNNKCEKCYYKCKNCLGYGDDTDNNCSECNGDMILLNDTNKNNCYNKCDNYYYFDENGAYICTDSLQCPEGYYNISIGDIKKCIKKEEESLTSELIINLADITSELINNIPIITSEIETGQENNERGIDALDKEILDFIKNLFNIKKLMKAYQKGKIIYK